MLKFKVELDLGNEAMNHVVDVKRALVASLDKFEVTVGGEGSLVEGDGGTLVDGNGNRVGVWGVERVR